MVIHMDALTITTLLIGASIGTFFMVFMIMSFKGDRARAGHPTVRDTTGTARKFASTMGLVLGTFMLGAWLYYFFEGDRSLSQRLTAFNAHAATMLFAGVTLWWGSFALARHRKRGPLIFVTAMGLLVFAILHALVQYGLGGHSLFKNGIAIVLLVVVAYLIGLVFAWEHFVLHLDEDDDASAK